MNLAKRVALVTGSTSGIGLGIARALAAEGADIVLNGFGEADAIERLRAEIADTSGVRVVHDGADMTRPDEIAGMVRSAQERLGRVDVLVNNAGIQHVAPIESFPPDRWDAVIAVNLSSAFHAMQAVIPAMRSGGWGRIINIASAHGLVGSPEKSAYVAAKHGLVELAADGITVNAICPGWVRTPLVERQLDARAARDGRDVAAVSDAFLADKQAMRRFTTPEQIGAMCVFLCSEAAATITGAPLSIDGGWVAQ